MALSDLTSRAAIDKAVEECDTLGESRFLAKYGFRAARTYFLTVNGKRYDSKAIVGAAHGYQFGKPLRAQDFSGGEFTVARKLRSLGYEVDKAPSAPGRSLRAPETGHVSINPGQTYSWDALGERFDFSPDYLGAAGGMISRPKQNALLIVTHPGGAKSFDYGDYWDGPDLIYAGRGKIGDQKFQGPNRDLAENRRVTLVFEPDGTRQLRFLGPAVCLDHWPTREPDQEGTIRRVFRYQLRFESTVAQRSDTRTAETRRRAPTTRVSRAFNVDAPPPAPPRPGQPGSTPEERAQRLEQATKGHHALVRALALHLETAGWKNIEEIPGGIDLWATKGNQRIIFEAKTLRDANAAHQVRLAIAQLLEYRFLYGKQTDILCLVVDAPVTEQRLALLESLTIGLLVNGTEGIHAAGKIAASVELFGQ